MMTKYSFADSQTRLVSCRGRVVNPGGCGSRMARVSHLKYVSFLTAIVVGLLFSSNVLAHKVRVFAYVEGDKLIVEGYFSKSAKARKPTLAGR